MSITLRQLANTLGLDFKGNADLPITGVASLHNAQLGDVCFISQSKYIKDIADSGCAAVILPLDTDLGNTTKGQLFSTNPQYSFAQAIEAICPERLPQRGASIHSSAQISESANIAQNVSIGAQCVIGANVSIGAGSHIGAGCIVEDDVTIGARCWLYSNVTVLMRVVIGSACILHPGVVLGSDGFGLVNDNGRWFKVPQVGRVVLGDDVEIGANTTVDRGALDDTVIEDGCKLDNLIQVAHNVTIGANTAIAGCVGIAGSAVIGRNCKIGGAASIVGHLSIADNVMITSMSMVTKSIKNPGVYSSGTPLLENSEWHKNNVRYKSLDKLARTVARLDKLS